MADFLARVPLAQEHLAVWSPSLVSCIFDSCSQLDSLWKLRASAKSDLKIKDHYQLRARAFANEWLVVWDGDGMRRAPFESWTQPSYEPLKWWQSYNALKHNRWENVKEATLETAIDACSALFLGIANDSACQEALFERKWIRTQFASDYVISKLASPEGILGVAVESKLFSYAIGSSHADFQKMLAYYHGCSRRFGKWLELKFGREFWLQEISA